MTYKQPYVAGNEFESFVTNNEFITKPFSGTNCPNPSSRFGVYQDNILPFDGGLENDVVYYHITDVAYYLQRPLFMAGLVFV